MVLAEMNKLDTLAMDRNSREFRGMSFSEPTNGSLSEHKRSFSFPNEASTSRGSFSEVISKSLEASKAVALQPVISDDWMFHRDDVRILPTSSEKKTGKGIRKMYLAALASLLSAVAMGMATGYSAPATYDMQERPSSSIKVNDDEVTWIGSIIALGALTGGLIAGPLADKIGRKGILIFNSFPFIVGWILIIYAPNVVIIYVGRIITGFSCGLVSVTVPMYAVEISTPEVRGLLGASFQGLLVVGSLISMTVGAILTWSWLAVACSVAVIAGLIFFFPMPESPRWLMAQGRREEAAKAIRFLQGDYLDAEVECNIIEDDLNQQPKGKLTLKEFLQPTVLKPALLSAAQMFFQQFSGANSILFYTSFIFESAGSSLDTKSSSILVAFIQVVATLLSSAIIDKAGRKVLLLISGIFMSLSLALMGTFYFISKHDPSFHHDASWVPLVSLVVFIAAFSIGYGPIPWLMVAEMVPVRARSIISGMATFFNGLFAFTVTKSFGSMQQVFQPYGAFWFYSAVSFLSCIFTWFFLPETKGKRLEEIQKFFTVTQQVNRRITAYSINLPEEQFP